LESIPNVRDAENRPQGERTGDECKKGFLVGASRAERLQEFARLMGTAAPAESRDDALRLIKQTLMEVEDRMTDIPYNPETSDSDGRMYEPLEENRRNVKEHPRVKRYRQRGHNTFVADNGAIEIRKADTNEVLLIKAGADGRSVWEA
jgi:hypothetical protein